jgi:phage shock protein C
MKNKKLYRNKQEAKLLGVCAGLADYFDIDVVMVRILWVIATFGLGLSVLAYFIAALIIPIRPEDVTPLGKA